MTEYPAHAEAKPLQEGALLLAIDTCGSQGSAALGRLAGDAVTLLGQIELEGRSYSATLIAAVGKLLASAGAELRSVAAIVVVNGPGSFTGVRVGLSAAKGMAEAAGLPLVALSRLEVMAAKAGLSAAVLDAHRHEVFLLVTVDGERRELLAGRAELPELPAPARIAVCDSSAAALVYAAWPSVELEMIAPPAASDALPLGLARLKNGLLDDVAKIDGHYLRRSDAEIFGEKQAAK